MLKNKPLAILLCMIAVILSGSLFFSAQTVRATSLPFAYDYSVYDLGTGAVEISAMTYNGSRDRLLVLDNAGSVVVHEFDVDSATGRPEPSARRQIELIGMGGDVEGLTWMQNDTFAVIDENTGQIHTFELLEGATDITVFGSPGAVIDTGIVENSGFGAEGLTYLPNHNGQDWFIAVDEGPTAVIAVPINGVGGSTTILSTPTLTDFSGAYLSPVDGMLYIVSDETSTIAQFQPDATLTAFAEVASQPLAAANVQQVEGVTFDPSMKYMYIASETETNAGNGFGLWVAPIAISKMPTSTAIEAPTTTPPVVAVPVPTATATVTPTPAPPRTTRATRGIILIPSDEDNSD